MNKRAFSKISIMFFALIFIILWAMFFAEILSTQGNLAVVNGDYSGIEALFYQNLNAVVGVVFFIGVLALGVTAE